MSVKGLRGLGAKVVQGGSVPWQEWSLPSGLLGVYGILQGFGVQRDLWSCVDL